MLPITGSQILMIIWLFVLLGTALAVFFTLLEFLFP
jgi:hypothetical protein